jgi:hypothetical protein
MWKPSSRDTSPPASAIQDQSAELPTDSPKSRRQMSGDAVKRHSQRVLKDPVSSLKLRSTRDASLTSLLLRFLNHGANKERSNISSKQCTVQSRQIQSGFTTSEFRRGGFRIFSKYMYLLTGAQSHSRKPTENCSHEDGHDNLQESPNTF